MPKKRNEKQTLGTSLLANPTKKKTNTVRHWDRAYRLPLSEIPWEIPEPPTVLTSFLDSGLVPPGKALDVACGSGNYSIFLAQRGFDVSGVDVSKNALALAREKIKNAGLEKKVRLVQADCRELAVAFKGEKFGLILDWSLLHHVAPEDVEAYAGQFSELLAPGGVLLLTCFSEKDAPQAGQTSATGKMGNVMYYRTRAQIESAYRPLKVLEYRECRLGKKGNHAGHCLLFRNVKAID